MKTMDIESGVFEVVVNKEFKDQANIIDHVKLHYVNSDSLAYIGNTEFNPTVEGDILVSGKDWKTIYNTDLQEGVTFYVSIHFRSALSKKMDYRKYNFESPLCYPVDLVKRKGIFGGPDVWYISRVMAEPNAQAFKELTDQVDEYQQ